MGKREGRLSELESIYEYSEKSRPLIVGEIRMFHDLGGIIPIPRGWMKLDGSQINQANYDALHGNGTWAEDNVSSSPIANKHLLNSIEKYAVGNSVTTQDGSSPAWTYVGNVNNQISLAHTHTYTHWHRWITSGPPNTTYDSAGASTAFNSGGTSTSGIQSDYDQSVNPSPPPTYLYTPRLAYYSDNDQYTDSAAPGTSAAVFADTGTSSTSIQPHSFEIVYIIRVVE
jgi:hypothetical protein